MFDFVSDIIASGDYEEIEGILSDLEYYTERAKQALKDLTKTVKYTWVNEKEAITRTGTLEVKCKDRDVNQWVKEILYEGEISEVASDLFTEYGLGDEGVDYYKWVDEFIENTQISYYIISQDD
nr:MAG TPA: hypothetical protein [Caudoviricetes sp.]